MPIAARSTLTQCASICQVPFNRSYRFILKLMVFDWSVQKKTFTKHLYKKCKYEGTMKAIS